VNTLYTSELFKKFTIFLCRLLKDICIQYAPNCQTGGGWPYYVCCAFRFNKVKDKILQAVAGSRFLMRTEYYSVSRRAVFQGSGRNKLPVQKWLVKSLISQSSFHLAYLYSVLTHIGMTDSIYIHT